MSEAVAVVCGDRGGGCWVSVVAGVDAGSRPKQQASVCDCCLLLLCCSMRCAAAVSQRVGCSCVSLHGVGRVSGRVRLAGGVQASRRSARHRCSPSCVLVTGSCIQCVAARGSAAPVFERSAPVPLRSLLCASGAWMERRLVQLGRAAADWRGMHPICTTRRV